MRVFSPTRFAEARKRAGLSQNGLSRLVGIHFTSISRIEMGTQLPSLHSLLAAADALGVTLDDLVFNTEETD